MSVARVSRMELSEYCFCADGVDDSDHKECKSV